MIVEQHANTTPLFSIIVPIYNSSAYLEKCIRSVLNQKYESIELILIDDKSTDFSASICDAYKSQKNIKTIYNQKNYGVGISRNIGISAAKGRYIIFLDSDDCLYNGCLKGLESLTKKNPAADVIIGKYSSDVSFYSNNYLFEKYLELDTSDKLIAHIMDADYRPNNCWHYIIKRSFMLKTGLKFIDAKVGEDQLFVTKMLCLMENFEFYNKEFYWYRGGGIGLSRAIDLKTTESFLKIIFELSKFLDQLLLSTEKYKFIECRITNACSEIAARISLHEGEEIHELAAVFEKMCRTHNIAERMFKKYDNKVPQGDKEDYFASFLEYRQTVIDYTSELIENVECKYDYIYIYCVSVFALATQRIFKISGFDVECFIDQNNAFRGKTYSGVMVEIPSQAFLRIKNSEIPKILVVVCTQQEKTFRKISLYLEMLGLNKKQVIFHSF
jgi:glycosyltransferase involved in cell wall biosynthesis